MYLPCVDSSHPTLGLAAAVVRATESSLAAAAIAVDHGPVLGQHEQSGSTHPPTTETPQVSAVRGGRGGRGNRNNRGGRGGRGQNRGNSTYNNNSQNQSSNTSAQESTSNSCFTFKCTCFLFFSLLASVSGVGCLRAGYLRSQWLSTWPLGHHTVTG